MGDNGRKGRRMELDSIGRLLLVLGAGVMVSGGLLLLVSRIPGINQLFNLPGDIRIETSGFSCFFPIVSMILISIVLTIVINVVIRLLNR
jgi:hypothetical protein